MKKKALTPFGGMLLSAVMSSLVGGALVSSVAMFSVANTYAASLEGVDGEHGFLTVTGELVDSPCRLSMDSRDQSVDLGTLASSELSYPGARSKPLIFSVRLEGCLVASGLIYDDRTGKAIWSDSQPVVDVAFTAPADFNDPSLMKLSGVKGIALRMTDRHNRDVRLGSHGSAQLLTPGSNVLQWTVVAERVPGPLVPGKFRAVANFQLSYD